MDVYIFFTVTWQAIQVASSVNSHQLMIRLRIFGRGVQWSHSAFRLKLNGHSFRSTQQIWVLPNNYCCAWVWRSSRRHSVNQSIVKRCAESFCAYRDGICIDNTAFVVLVSYVRVNKPESGWVIIVAIQQHTYTYMYKSINALVTEWHMAFLVDYDTFETH